MRRKDIQDFDFLYGQWLVRNRRLRQCLDACDEWYEFDSMHKCWPLLDGLGNIDEYLGDDSGPSGALMRFFDPQSRRWTMRWVSARDGIMQPPVRGAFRNDIGEFHGESRFNGRPIRVRYIWDKIDPDSPRWEQSFSDDGGTTWETNWIMHFTRLDWPFEAGVSLEGGWKKAGWSTEQPAPSYRNV